MQALDVAHLEAAQQQDRAEEHAAAAAAVPQLEAALTAAKVHLRNHAPASHTNLVKCIHTQFLRSARSVYHDTVSSRYVYLMCIKLSGLSHLFVTNLHVAL